MYITKIIYFPRQYAISIRFPPRAIEMETDILIKEKRAMHLELLYNVYCCIYTDGLLG